MHMISLVITFEHKVRCDCAVDLDLWKQYSQLPYGYTVKTTGGNTLSCGSPNS